MMELTSNEQEVKIIVQFVLHPITRHLFSRVVVPPFHNIYTRGKMDDYYYPEKYIQLTDDSMKIIYTL